MSHHTNVVRIKAVARALQELNEQVVFIGGAVVSLYVDKPDRIDVRATDDVDVIIEIANRGQYMILQERLRAIGFREDAESDVICRWRIDGIVVDVMPTDAAILGFTNPWYQDGINNKITADLDGTAINLLNIPYFLATKLEALFNREGGLDWRWSSDFEDIIKLIRECDLETIYNNIESEKLKAYLQNSFDRLMRDEGYFLEACMAHLVAPFYGEEDRNIISQRIKRCLPGA